MKTIALTLTLGALVLSLCSGTVLADKNEPAAIGKTAPAFSLKDSNGKTQSLSDFEGKYVVLEWTNVDCPFVRKHYESGNMQELQKKYTDKDVVWLRICSSGPGNQGYYSGDQINERSKKEKAHQSAYLADADGTVGRQYGAKTTPHMFVIDKEGILIYAGAIDDKPSTKTGDIEGATNYVAAALDAAMSDKPVETKTSVPYGCSVKYKK